MIKKAFIVITVIGYIQFIIVTCCPDPQTYYNSITNVEVKNCNLQTEILDSSLVSQDNFRIKLTITEETFVKLFNPLALINSAYATSCEDHFVGLKSDITEFTIICNKEIFNMNAGESIDYDRINVYKIGFYEDSKNFRQTIDEWIDILNNGGYYWEFEWYFEFKEPIISNDYLKFKIYIKQEDGTEFEVETKSAKIE